MKYSEHTPVGFSETALHPNSSFSDWAMCVMLILVGFVSIFLGHVNTARGNLRFCRCSLTRSFLPHVHWLMRASLHRHLKVWHLKAFCHSCFIPASKNPGVVCGGTVALFFCITAKRMAWRTLWCEKVKKSCSEGTQQQQHGCSFAEEPEERWGGNPPLQTALRYSDMNVCTAACAGE